MMIAKTSITFTVLHDAEHPPRNLQHAVSEAWDGAMVGVESDPITTVVPAENVESELLAMGNDGSFFEGMTA